ncbi:MAG: ATPase domain-containing protein [Candidatus Methanofastidiosia archaeon]
MNKQTISKVLSEFLEEGFISRENTWNNRFQLDKKFIQVFEPLLEVNKNLNFVYGRVDKNKLHYKKCSGKMLRVLLTLRITQGLRSKEIDKKVGVKVKNIYSDFRKLGYLKKSSPPPLSKNGERLAKNLKTICERYEFLFQNGEKISRLNWFFKLIEGGIPTKTNMLLTGPSGSGKSIISQQLIYEELLMGNSCLYIASRNEVKRIRRENRIFKWDVSKYLKAFRLGCIEISEDLTLTDSSIEITEMLGKLKKPISLIVLDSLTILSVGNKKTTVVNFIRNLFRRAERLDHGIILVWIPTKKTQELFEHLMSMVDGVIETKFEREEKEMYLRFYKMSNRKISKNWNRFLISDLGVSFLEEKPLQEISSIPKIQFFVGREDELRRLEEASNNIVVLEGIAGIGKTALLSHLERKLQKGYKIYWQTLREIDTFDSILFKLFLFLEDVGDLHMDFSDFSKKDEGTKVNLVIRGLEKIECVLFFDDYRSVRDDKINTLFEMFKEKVKNTRIFVASRHVPKFCTFPRAEGVTQQTIDGLRLKDTSRFLSEKGVNLDREMLGEVREKLGGHPLSLEMFCHLARKGNPEEVLREIPETGVGDFLWNEIYEKLSPEEQELLESISVFRKPLSLEALLEICREIKVKKTLRMLENKLLVKKQKNTYLVHEVIRNFCYQLLDDPRELHTKAANYYSKKIRALKGEK